MRYFNFKLSLKLGWCHVRDIFRITISADHRRFSTVGSSCSQIFFKKGVLKNFAIFTGFEPLFNRVAGLNACSFTKETPTQVFSCEYCEILKNTLFHGTPLNGCFSTVNLLYANALT